MKQPTDNEKRQELRLCAEETVFIEVESDEESEEAQIVIGSSVDVSANGLQMVLDRPLLEGSIHRLCLQLGDQRQWYLSAAVIWSRQLDDDEGHAVGLQVLESDGTDVQSWKTWIADRWGCGED